MRLRDAYEVLELEVGAEEAHVRQARNILLKVWHPDRHQNDERLLEAAKHKTRQVIEAFESIERAGFPDVGLFASETESSETAREAANSDRELRLRELAVRERELAMREREVEKPTVTEWVDKKAQSAGEAGKVLLIGIALALLMIGVLAVAFGGK